MYRKLIPGRRARPLATMTVAAAALPAAATAAAGIPRGRLILLAGVVLVLLAGVLLAVTALSPSAAPPVAGEQPTCCVA